MRYTLVLVMWLAGVAHADVVKISRPTNAVIERAALDVWLHPDRASVRMTLVVAGIDGEPRDPELPLELPDGARVTELSLSTLAVETTRAIAMEPSKARAEYGRSRTSASLLEAAGGTRYRIGVTGVTRARPTTIVIGFSTPRRKMLDVTPVGFVLAQLDVELAGDGLKSRSQSWRDVNVSRGLALPAPPRTLADSLAIGRAVDSELTLIAIARVRAVLGPMISIGAPVDNSECCFCHPPIRKHVKRQIPRLRHCYMREAQRDPTLEGTVELQFLIATDGTMTPAPSFDGTLADAKVHACLRAEIATWKIEPVKTPIQVNYPLTFRLAP